MSRAIAIERSEKGWKTGRLTGGVCFTISWDRFEEILKTGKLPKAFPNWHLKSNEYVTRFEIGTDGVTVFIGKE